MINKIQMCFQNVGGALRYLKLWNRSLQYNASVFYKRMEHDRREGFGPIYLKSFEPKIIEIDNKMGPNDELSEGLKHVNIWISDKEYYFFELVFENSDSEKVKLHQFIFLTNIIVKAKGDRTPVKLYLADQEPVMTTVRVATAIMTLARCKNGEISRMLIDMAIDNEIE